MVSLFTVLYSWIIVIRLGTIFTGREILEDHIKQYKGEELRRIMLDDSDRLAEAGRRLKSSGLAYAVQVVLIAALALSCATLNIKIPPVLFAALILFFAGAVWFFALSGLFNREHFFAGEGIALAAGERFRAIGGISLFVATAAAFAALLASNNNLLPISIITAFLAWLWELLSRIPLNRSGVAPASDAFVFKAPQPMLPPELMALESGEPWPFWGWLKNLAIVFLAFLFLWFMIKPLFTRSRGDGQSLLEKLGRLFVEWFRGLRAGLAAFFSSLRKGDGSVRINTNRGTELRRLETELLAGYSSAKKRDMKRSVNLFARLILWGSECCHVDWKASRGPGEYCGILSAAAAPDVQAAIIRCGELFEEALYSPRVLSGEAKKEFAELIEGIIK
jgi:hypothetical protein